MRAPANHEILLAEQNLMQSRRELVAGTARLKKALRATLARPSTLLAVAGAAGVAGYLMFRRPAVRVEYGSRGASGAATAAVASTSVAGLIVAFAMRYAMQRLPGIGLRLVEQAVRTGGARPRAGRASAMSAQCRPGSSMH